MFSIHQTGPRWLYLLQSQSLLSSFPRMMQYFCPQFMGITAEANIWLCSLPFSPLISVNCPIYNVQVSVIQWHLTWKFISIPRWHLYTCAIVKSLHLYISLFQTVEFPHVPFSCVIIILCFLPWNCSECRSCLCQVTIIFHVVIHHLWVSSITHHSKSCHSKT